MWGIGVHSILTTQSMSFSSHYRPDPVPHISRARGLGEHASFLA